MLKVMPTPQNLITVLDLHCYIFSVHSNLKRSNVKLESLLKISFETKCINHKILHVQFKLYKLTQHKHKKLQLLFHL